MQRVIAAGYTGIVAVERQQVLRKVIGANRYKVDAVASEL
jgi:hypothetical protein